MPCVLCVCVLDVCLQGRGRTAFFGEGAPAGEHREASRSLSGDGGAVCTAWENAPAHETQVHTLSYTLILSHRSRLILKSSGFVHILVHDRKRVNPEIKVFRLLLSAEKCAVVSSLQNVVCAIIFKYITENAVKVHRKLCDWISLRHYKKRQYFSRRIRHKKN